MQNPLHHAFARNLREARRILEAVGDIVRINDAAIEQSRQAVRDSRALLDSLDCPTRPDVP